MKKIKPLIFSIIYLLLSGSALAANYVVTSTEDALGGLLTDGICLSPFIGGGPCTLRAAIQESNETPGKDTIVLAANAIYELTREGTKEFAAATGDLNIYDDVDIVGNGATIDGKTLDRVFFIERVNVKIQDLTIINGSTNAEGGGLLAINANVELANVTMTDNSSGSYGGAVAAGGGSLVISGSTFNTNNALQGGAVSILESSLDLSNSFFNDNSSDMGGGIYAGNLSALQISNTDFNRNISAMMGGAIHIEGFEDEENVVASEFGSTNIVFTMTNVNFTDNESLSAVGGGVYVDNLLASVYETSLSINTCAFNGNKAYGGGGIWVRSGSLTVANCTFDSNLALSNDGYGGAVYTAEPVTVSNTTFTNNFSTNEGGALFSESEPVLTAVTASENISNNEDVGEGLFFTSDEEIYRDTDGDGILDTIEDGNRTNPLVADTDGDGVDDGEDNCALKTNPEQANSGGSVPGGIDIYGDDCQCGDVNNDNQVNNTDTVLIIRHVAGLPPGVDLTRCDVDGDGLCNTDDATKIRNFLTGEFTGNLQLCAAAADIPVDEEAEVVEPQNTVTSGAAAAVAAPAMGLASIFVLLLGYLGVGWLLSRKRVG